MLSCGLPIPTHYKYTPSLEMSIFNSYEWLFPLWYLCQVIQCVDSYILPTFPLFWFSIPLSHSPALSHTLSFSLCLVSHVWAPLSLSLSMSLPSPTPPPPVAPWLAPSWPLTVPPPVVSLSLSPLYLPLFPLYLSLSFPFTFLSFLYISLSLSPLPPSLSSISLSFSLPL